MVKKFFIGVAVILAIYIAAAWGIVELAGFQTEKIKGLYYSGILATINVVVAFMILKLAMPKDQKTFAKIFLLGMVLRLLGLLISIFIIFKYSEASHFVFIGSLFILYFMYQIWEVLILNSKKK